MAARVATVLTIKVPVALTALRGCVALIWLDGGIQGVGNPKP